MGMVAILVMWTSCREQTSIPPSNCFSVWNLALISPVVSDEKAFEEFSLYESK